MDASGICEKDREHLKQIHGFTHVSAMGDRTASMTNTGKWKQPPTPISPPSNTSFNLNPLSGRIKDNLYAKDGNPNRSATLVARKKQRIEPTFKPDMPWSGRQTNKRSMLPRDSEPHTMPLPESINIVDEEDEDIELNLPEGDLSHKTRFDGSTERTSGFRKVTERIPMFIADKSHSAPSPSSSIESFGDEDKPGIVKRKVHQYENLVVDNNGRGSQLDLRKVGVKNRMKGRERVPTTFTNFIKPVDSQDSLATSTTPYENKGKAKQTQGDIRIPISEWYMGALHILDTYTLSAGETCLEIQSTSDTKSLRFSDINSVTLSSSAPNTHGLPPHLQITTKPSRSLSRLWGSDEYFQPGERDKGLLTFRADIHDDSWNPKKWDALKQRLKRSVDHCTESLSSKALWEIASCVAAAINSKRVFIEDEDETPVMAAGDKKRRTTATNFAKDPPSNQEGIHKYLVTPRPKAQATYGSTGSKSLRASNQEEGVQPPSLSRRWTRQAERKPPAEDPDEVILVYPPSTTGAVNITNADLNRLQPGEFLNDTIIEFGLKLWHKELEETNPELAKQIHIFNSFFYKKLNKKNIEESYKTVARWTSKIDIFKKKYVVVPINENVHWYLAVIYQPQYVLFPPKEKVPPATRGRTRLSQSQSEGKVGESVQHITEAQAGGTTDEKAEAKENASETPIGINDDDADELMAPSMAEEEIDELASDYEKEPDLNIVASITTPHDDSDVTPMEVDNDDDGGSSDSVSAQLQDISVGGDDVTMADLEETKPQGNKPPSIQPIPPKAFYENPSSIKGKEKATEVEEPLEIVDSSLETLKTIPYIIIMDSLGQKHPRAVNTLASYLKFEAMDKQQKEADAITKAVGKYAQVPLQPNFCDCGIYLLHFVRTFVSKTDHLVKVITKERAGRQSDSQADRHEDWDARNVDSHRQQLSDRIEELSREWKNNRASRAAVTDENKPTKIVEVIGSSDSEIDIVGESTKKKVPRQNSKQKSKQIIQKANRVR
ncbi:hypothetical protein E1B28_012254 [Marasmius oreades]|uniref:Ubiquitin-like protease family profile domain-containing protein n=1 Tax=Marasmius oreades TaxID=181124 RepID=A0A9P7RRX4_9AGAR|nr:uncharacterized protein E1B28_012254 [Marasmius oreades]KAG7088240.1 hypothetical protein E1B28_012254 [Marasmius oreades]